MGDSRVDKWRGWINGRIHDEVVTMHLHRDVYQRVGNMAEEGLEPPTRGL